MGAGAVAGWAAVAVVVVAVAGWVLAVLAGCAVAVVVGACVLAVLAGWVAELTMDPADPAVLVTDPAVLVTDAVVLVTRVVAPVREAAVAGLALDAGLVTAAVVTAWMVEGGLSAVAA